MLDLLDKIKNLIPVQVRELGLKMNNFIRAFFMPEPWRTVFPYTMVGIKRLRKLYELCRQLDSAGIPGDIVECGTCNGGSGALLAQAASGSKFNRHTWLLDSFAGLPAPGEKDGLGLAPKYSGRCLGSAERVKEVLAKLGVPLDKVSIVKGWFNQTLPKLPVSKVALLHIDADFYDSVMTVLEQLYDKVAPGGCIVLDDYGYWEGCRKACDEFLASRGLKIELSDIDGIGAYFYKE